MGFLRQFLVVFAAIVFCTFGTTAAFAYLPPAIAQSLCSGTLDGSAPDESDTAAYAAWQAQVADQAQLIGASVGYITSAGRASNVSNGGSIAQSGVVNNYLNHTEWGAYLDALVACGTDTECLDATNQIYWLVSAENTQRMALCGSNAECLQEHYDAMLAVRADAELYAKAQALSGNIGAEIRALEHADARHVVNPGGQWGTNYASYALRACGGQTSTGCFAAYYDDMKSNWLLSGGSDAMFGFAISAGIAVTPSTLAALRTCAATRYCMSGLATELAAGALGEVQGVMMMTAAVGGSSRLVLQHGDEIIGVMDDFGNILKATDQSFLGRILFEAPQGGVAYFDDAGRLVRGQIDETGQFSRDIEHILVDGEVPGAKVDFDQWASNLSPEDIRKIWEDPDLRTDFKNMIRQGGDHEWCMCEHYDRFAEWGLSLDDVRAFSTRTSELRWTVPGDVPKIGGQSGGHISSPEYAPFTGSTRFHNELSDLISSSPDIDSFYGSLPAFAER